MARTASTGFFQRKCLLGLDPMSTTMYYLIDDSATIKVGDAIVLDSDGNARRAIAGEPIIGVSTGLVDRNGLNIFTPQASGTTGATLTEDDQVAASATNTTDGTRNLKVAVNICPFCVYYNDADGDLARTNLLNFFDSSATGNQITQSTALETNGQWQLIQVDPDGDADLSKGLFRIAESQIIGIIDSATDKIPA